MLQEPSTGTESLVAIKTVNLSKLNTKLKENLSSEIEILKGLHHPHIVALIDRKESSQHINLVMEYCALGDLSYFIRKRDKLGQQEYTADMIQKYPNPRTGGLNEVVVRHFLKQLADALKFLREKNLIHRDVKPQNLLLNPSPQYLTRHRPERMPYSASNNSLTPRVGLESLPMLKIADFGFARSLPATSLAETLCGSPLYMAPEILGYQKYDAIADLWSVGAVLFEMMTAKPPFRAQNHVELYRKIEKTDDRIKFPDDIIISSTMKQTIRSLLKKNPKDRISFPEFFSSPILIDEIPGLVGDDIGKELKLHSGIARDGNRSSLSTRASETTREDESAKTSLAEKAQTTTEPTMETPGSVSRHSMNARRSSFDRRLTSEGQATREGTERPPSSTSARRPSMVSHATAPARPNLSSGHNGSTTVTERPSSRNNPSPIPSPLKHQAVEKEKERVWKKREEQEREHAAQDIAFERDYVLVEKKAVEVNAFADELAANPRLQRNGQSGQSNAMVRRATTQGPPSSVTGAQYVPSKAVQIVGDRGRPDSLHHRQSSYERRYGPSPTSATSAISKALNMASGRLFGAGISPPLTIGIAGRSPPLNQNPFPAYPTNQGSLIFVGESTKQGGDPEAVVLIEECATRSDVVYGFAEVKYHQLIPLAPSVQPSSGLRGVSADTAASALDEGLTVEAIVTISEEALVLYVKALSLLARSTDIAGAWWARKNRGEILGDASCARSAGASSPNGAVGNRINNVVQWVRNRFNDVLEKADFVRLKLIESQKRLPPDHPGHPSNHSATTRSGSSIGTSVDQVVVSSGITAEKLMYDRAVEMSRGAAINELTGDDLPGCEVAYFTAIRMLEAVLEVDEELHLRSSTDNPEQGSNDEDAVINGLEAEERKAVTKCMILQSLSEIPY